MWFFDFFKSQKIDVIKWDNPSDDVLIKKWDHKYDELKNKSSLIVDPGLAAIFVHNGKIEALEETPWKWSLETANIPFITSLKNFMSAFESHDKASVFFVKTSLIANQKWGTPNDVTYTDPVYNFPVDLRLFGNFTFSIRDIESFWTNYVANKDEVQTLELRKLINDRLVWRIASVLAGMKISYSEVDAKAFEISESLLKELAPEFESLGLEIHDFRIEDTSFSPRTEELIAKIMDKRADAMAVNEAANIDKEAMDSHIELEKVWALRDAANSTGWASEGLSAGMGMAMWMNMANELTNNNQENSESVEEKLEKAKSMFEKGLIDKEEYKKLKADILK